MVSTELEAPRSPKGGRPRTFPLGIITIDIERKASTGETWRTVALELGIKSGTLRSRACEFHRVQTVHKTPAWLVDTRR